MRTGPEFQMGGCRWLEPFWAPSVFPSRSLKNLAVQVDKLIRALCLTNNKWISWSSMHLFDQPASEAALRLQMGFCLGRTRINPIAALRERKMNLWRWVAWACQQIWKVAVAWARAAVRWALWQIQMSRWACQMDRGSDGCWCDVINDASQSFGRYNKETCGPTHIIDLDSKSEFTKK